MRNPLARYRQLALGLIAASLFLGGCALSGNRTHTYAGAEVTVFRSPTCGCCGQWVEHMKAAGFQVKDNITEDMDAVKQQYDVMPSLNSCHTALVGDYIVEGHVPAEDVQRLLIDQPDVLGIAVPGMPIGSPGMESGDYVEPYTVFSFTEDGETAAFAEHS